MPSITNPWVLLGFIASLALAVATGWKLRGDHEGAEKLSQALAYAEEVKRRQGRVDALAVDLETARAAQKPKDRIITKEVVRYETVVPAVRRCSLDGAWRLLHDAAATGNPTEPARLAAGDTPGVTDAAALDTVAGNYEGCRDAIGQVIGWQRFWETVTQQ